MEKIFKMAQKNVPFMFLILVLANLFPLLANADEKMFRNSLGMEFVLISPGTFIMGSPTGEFHRSPNEVQHQVTISKPFYMQTTEVTLKQWRAIMGKRFFFRKKGTEHMPVVKVSWFDCQDFINKLNARLDGTYRLPTEAEWEYACRGGSTTAYSWGETIDCSKAMYENSKSRKDFCVDYTESKGLQPNQPAPVKTYPPNAWGLYDMHGNVWEWCHDAWGPYPAHPVTDPRGPESGYEKIRRGGSWYGAGYSCRSANRAKARPGNRLRTTGFRLIWAKDSGWVGGKRQGTWIERIQREQEGGP